MRVDLSGFVVGSIIITAGLIAYLSYKSYLPGTLYLFIYQDGPCVPTPGCPWGCAATVDPTILQIQINFSRIQLHASGQPNGTGWHTIMETTHPSTLSFSGAAFWTFRLSHGAYDGMTFNVTNIVVKIEGVGNVSYTAVGGGFQILFHPGFQIQPNRESSAEIYVRLLSTEIHAQNSQLHLIGLIH